VQWKLNKKNAAIRYLPQPSVTAFLSISKKASGRDKMRLVKRELGDVRKILVKIK